MIGIDIMGGDHPPENLLSRLDEIKEPLKLALISPKPFPEIAVPSPHTLEYIEAESVIGMDEDPLKAIRSKKNSTIQVGMELVKSGKLKALVSTGNTGALLASAVHTLPMQSGVKRPGLLATLPTTKGPLVLIDVGANLACSAAQLVTFAKLGAMHQMAMGIQAPRIGILNIGEEAHKGKPELIEAHGLLRAEFKESFVGNIEGVDAFSGSVDVLVTDGFTGNVLLKTAEGMASYIHKRIGSVFPGLETLITDLSYTKHPGAILAGVKGTVIKCHGRSDQDAILSAVQGCLHLARKGVNP